MTAGRDALPSGMPVIFSPPAAMPQSRDKPVVLACAERAEPPKRPECVREQAGCSQEMVQRRSAEHPAQDAALPPLASPALARLEGETTFRRGAGGAAGHWQQCFASLRRPLVLPTFGLTSSNASMSQPVTRRCILLR